jgi:hypothetical protein
VAEFEWRTDELRAFAKSLNSDKDGRALKKQMEAQFDSITESLRDRLREELADLPGAGRYPEEAAESVEFKTKLIGGKNARVSIVGEGRTPTGKWREIGALLERGVLYHPAWGRWLSAPPPSSLRQDVPSGPRMVTDVLSKEQPVLADEIRSVLNDYLDKLTDIRRA